MTEQEILAMETGRRLDKRIAEDVMGCKVVKDDIFGDIQIDEQSAWMPLQPYSSDKSAALSILDKVEQDYQQRIEVDRFESQWEADLTPGRGGVSNCYPAYRALSLPEAICKAALMIVHKNGKTEQKVGEGRGQGEDADHSDTLDEIVRIELDMLQKITADQPSLLGESPKTFRMMREINYSVLSPETLASYLDDLQKANLEGRNLLVEKYARIQGSIPPLKISPMIDEIVRTEAEWMDELAHKYPLRFGSNSDGSQKYLACELETVSDRTLSLYRRDIYQAKQDGRNLAEERYAQIFRLSGYGSLAEAERASAKTQ